MELLPMTAVPTSAVLLIGLEFFSGAGILIKRSFPISALFAAGLFFLFGSAVAVNLLRGRRELPCGCFGKKGTPISWHLVARDILLAVASLLATEFFSGRLLIFLIACAVIAGICVITPRVWMATSARA